jgi:hypothetical protein
MALHWPSVTSVCSLTSLDWITRQSVLGRLVSSSYIRAGGTNFFLLSNDHLFVSTSHYYQEYNGVHTSRNITKKVV